MCFGERLGQKEEEQGSQKLGGDGLVGKEAYGAPALLGTKVIDESH
jgi:hypothetical protein